MGEQLAAEALGKIDQAAATSRLILLALIVSLIAVGAVLAYTMVGVVQELRRSQAEQRLAAKKLAEASQAKTDFIADVSHELRTPLTVLRGNAEVGLQLERDCDHAELLDEIVRESGRMSRMVEDLLLLARSDSATLPLELEPVPVAPFLAEIEGRAAVLARERNATLKTELGGEGRIEIDAARIEQAILILVDNAAKYSPAEGQIMMSSETNSGEVCIRVIDQGPGIPEEELPHIFERFYRVDKARTRKKGGAGLGLPIAKTILEAHGGRIEAETCVGEGTRMSLYLPLVTAKDPESRLARDLIQ